MSANQVSYDPYFFMDTILPLSLHSIHRDVKPRVVLGKAALLVLLSVFISLFADFPAWGQVSAGVPPENEFSRQIAQTTTAPNPQAPGQQEDISELLQKLLDHDPQIRVAASQSLGTIPPEVRIPALVKALSDPNWKIQVLAAYRLGQMGAGARAAIPALTETMSNANPDIRFTVAKALGNIGSEAAVPALTQALQDKDENVRMATAEALDKLGPDAQTALPVLTKTLRDGNWFVRSRAAATFVRLAALSKSMLPVLLKAVDNPLQESGAGVGRKKNITSGDKNEIPAVVAIDALAEIGPELRPLLIESLNR